MTKPSLGRIVIVYSTVGPSDVPAIITHVHSDTMVNLTVFQDAAPPTFRTSVQLRESRPEEPNTAEAWWPPRV